MLAIRSRGATGAVRGLVAGVLRCLFWLWAGCKRGGAGSRSLPRCPAERQAYDWPDDRIADDADLAQGDVIDRGADEAHRAHRSGDQHPVAHGGISRRMEYGRGEQKGEAKKMSQAAMSTP
jgi:hypothetical protein